MTMEEPGLVFHVIAEAGDNVNIVNSFIEYLTDVFAHDKKEILEFCEVCLCQVCCYSCVFGKRNYRVLVRVSVCVCVFLHDNSKRNRSRNTKLEYTVVYENSSDEFDIELHRIKVKVTVGVQKFSPFTTIQTVRSYSSTLVQARNLILSIYLHLILIYKTTNVKNMHPHRDSNPGPWITVPML